MKICLVQYSPEWENIDLNIEKVKTLFSNFNEKVDLIIFPELTLTGFTMNSSKFAEEIDGRCTQFFIGLSKRLKTNIIAGLVESDDGSIFNSAVHFDNGIIMARYRKIHPFSMAGENNFYSASRETIVTKINNVQIGLSVCYDLRFPELYRLYAKKRTDIIVNIANWPIPRIEHWKTLLKARAIENLCYIIGVNRVGDDPNVSYNGFSSIFDPTGKEIICVENDEKLLLTELDIDVVKQTRERFNFLEDMELI
ncbi:MAG: nitrilase [Ignavibacteriales bacterium CG_4_9_14_3_um_filter_34_10]|nr:MAG: nitrilase [Ignavibacteriales bacterium CG_4_9_14_3_um_filter_34_10]